MMTFIHNNQGNHFRSIRVGNLNLFKPFTDQSCLLSHLHSESGSCIIACKKNNFESLRVSDVSHITDC